MYKSKTAFTMIELIFVIVILGILAAVAVPKLAATRADAKVVTIAQNIMVGTGEIAAYAIARGTTDTNLSFMSNSIEVLETEGNALLTNSTATIIVGSINDCVILEVFSNADEQNLTISFGSAGSDSMCLTIQSLIDIGQYPVQLTGGSVSY